MDAASLLAALRGRGFAVRVREDGLLGVTPAERLSDTDKAALREHKEALLDLLHCEQPGPDGPVNFPYEDRPAWIFRGLCVPWPKEENCNGEKSEG